MGGSKVCNSCGVSHPLSEYSPDKRNADGRQGRCKACQKAAVMRYQAANREAVLARKRKYNNENAEKIAIAAAAYRARTKEQAAAHNRRWLAANPEKNREKVRAYEARKRRAVPAWADQRAISEIYARAERMRRETGLDYQVDHIVPLNSPLVQGFHVAANLQIITGAENAAKRNRHWPDMP